MAGGTGAVGRHVVEAVAARGHSPVVLARSHGVDVLGGTGLDAAMDGVDAVVDIVNIATTRRRRAVEFFTTTTRTLLDAGRRAGVGHHVALSIVGIDRVDWGYYEGKRQQEDLVLYGPVPSSVLRATQFHDFPGQVLAGSRGPVAPVPRMRTQPVAAREVARTLVELAEGPVVGRAPDLAGPLVHELADLARLLVRARRLRRTPVAVPLPGAAGRAMALGALLPTGPGPRGVQTFQQWLDEQQAHWTPPAPWIRSAVAARLQRDWWSLRPTGRRRRGA